MSQIHVVDYGPQYEAAHAEFAAACWPNKLRRRDPAYNRWKFRGPAEGPVPGLLLAMQDDEVVGQLGMLPGKADVNGVVQPVQWACDLMVNPVHRRKGIATTLFQAAMDRDILILGPDPSPATGKVFQQMGYRTHESSYLMVLMLKAGPVVTERYPQLSRLTPLINAAGAPALAYLKRHLRAARNDHDAVMCSWRDVVDLVADAESKLTAPHAIHDEDFLAWRCTGLDGFNRELDAVRTPAGSFAILERGDRHLVVHQWRADSDDEAAKLFARVEFIGQSFGFDYIQGYAIDELARARMERLGFEPCRVRCDFWTWPADALDGATGCWAFQGYDSDYRL